MAMSSRSKQLLCFAAGFAVGVATTSAGQIVMLVARRPAVDAPDGIEPAPRPDAPTADAQPEVPVAGRT
jgi:hypothetical protein